MTADHHCKQEAKISAHGEQIKGICEKLDEFKQDIKADIQRIFQKLDERPSWKITAGAVTNYPKFEIKPFGSSGTAFVCRPGFIEISSGTDYMYQQAQMITAPDSGVQKLRIKVSSTAGSYTKWIFQTRGFMEVR